MIALMIRFIVGTALAAVCLAILGFIGIMAYGFLFA